jgi:Phosphopantetheine attachment site
VLGLERIGRHDNFFDLGGHSLLAVRAVSRIRQLMGVEAGVGVIFDAPSPAAATTNLLLHHQAETLQFQRTAEVLLLELDQMSDEEILARLQELEDETEPSPRLVPEATSDEL